MAPSALHIAVRVDGRGYTNRVPLLVGLTPMASSATTGGGGSVVSDGWGIKKAIRGGWLFMGREWDQRITLMVAAPVVMMAGPERAEASMAVPVARRRRVPWRV